MPVLNEEKRIADCLESLIGLTKEVREILVVDGRSSDRTAQIVAGFCGRDRRVQFIDASPVDPRWTGKAWGLYFGLQRSNPSSEWILCLDADVRVSAKLVRSLLEHVQRTAVTNFSLATEQHLSGTIDALLHPAMLTTLVYRFGAPGKASRAVHRVQANGQCFLSRRETLLRTQAFSSARASLCEDVTIARRLAECGESVGFYEAQAPIASVNMYRDWREIWANWPRSLPMRNQYFGWREAISLLGVLVVQGLPLPMLIASISFGLPLWFSLATGLLILPRVGILIATSRAYSQRPWSYWLSPLLDLPVILRIIQFALRRRHQWRGRTYIRRKGGGFEPLGDSRSR